MNIDLQVVKDHLRLDHTYDDEYIMLLIDVVIAQVERELKRPYEYFIEKCIDIQPLTMAILLTIGHYYNNRESVTVGSMVEIPLGYQRIIDLYKKPY